VGSKNQGVELQDSSMGYNGEILGHSESCSLE